MLLAWLLLAALGANAAPADAKLKAPRLQGPAAGASAESLPAFTWGSVRGAAKYQFELSADPKFTSGVDGFGNGPLDVSGTAVTSDRTVPNGTYYWRVRGVSAADQLGRWSRARTVHKAWNVAPSLLGPLGSTVDWPATPLVLRWSPVPYAAKYDVWIATDPALSNLVGGGSVSSPLETYATVFAYPSTLPPGTYYWAITPVDARGNKGPRSSVSTFTWAWPSTTAPAVTNIATSPGVFDPQFSWAPVLGASGYEVEVNSAQDFPPGSKFCCDGITSGTTLSPTRFLPNATYYWRVRAIDAQGDAGVWNVGQAFSETYDALVPTVPNLQLRDIHNNMAALAPSSPTDTPIITWSAVAGASSYEIQITPYVSGFGCDYTGTLTFTTASTAWTPLSKGVHIGPSAWPKAQEGPDLAPGSYCFKILARRDDGSDQGEIVSDWTQLGGFNQPAFDFTGYPAGSGPLQPTSTQYLGPANGSTTSRTPLFTWSPVPGANGYYVVVARDSAFTDVVDIGFTRVPVYAPEIGNGAPYADETTAYWWAVVPAANTDGTGVNTDPEFGQDNPQTFNKSSIPPVPLAPTGGADGGVQPTFRWTAAEGARHYQLQVSGDPSFANPMIDITTDSSAYTTDETLPADVDLYWRVRADDAENQGLNWSAVSTFRHHLPAPAPSPGNPSGGHTIPVLSWNPVPGAIGYDIHVDQPDGSTKDGTVDAPAFAPTQWYGTGIWRWQVRADFPGHGQTSSAYFTPEATYTRVLPPPSGVQATKSGQRVLLSWSPDSDAVQYQVQLSTTDGFDSSVAQDQTDNTAWAPQVDATTAALKLYWRVAAIDSGGNTGAFASGVFNAPRRHGHHKRGHHHKRGKRSRHHRKHH